MRNPLVPALLLVLTATAAMAALPTTTVNGKVYLPDGTTAAGGVVDCALAPTAGTVLDGNSQAQVAPLHTKGTIAADGTVTGLALVPNDAITPSGTYYDVRFTTTAPVRATWVVRWRVDSTPNPVAVGAISRLDVVPGIAVGNFLLFTAAEPTGACQAAETPRQATSTGRTCACTVGAWLCLGGTSDTLQGANGVTLLPDTDANGTGVVKIGHNTLAPASQIYTPFIDAWGDNTSGAAGFGMFRLTSKHAPTGTPDPNASTTTLDAVATGGFSGTYPNLVLRGARFQASLNYGTTDTVTGAMDALHGMDAGAVTYKTESGALAIGEITGGHYTVNNNGPGVTLTEMRAIMAKVSGAAGMTTAKAYGLTVRPPSLSGHTVTDFSGIVVTDQAGGTQTAADAIRVDAQGYGSAAKGNIRLAAGTWNQGHLVVGTTHLWTDARGLRWKESAPTGATDGLPLQVLAGAARDARSGFSGAGRGLYDTWTQVFRDRPLTANFGNGYINATIQIKQCYGGTCTGDQQYLCAASTGSDADGDGTMDLDGDGNTATDEFKVGDVIYIGDTASDYIDKGPTYTIIGRLNDTANCGSPNGVRVQVNPWVDQVTEGVGAGKYLHNVWHQRVHPGYGGWNIAGYQATVASRIPYGVNGPNLIANPAMDFTATMYGWTYAGAGAAAALSWVNNPLTFGANPWLYQELRCAEGPGANSCFYMSGTTSTDYVESNAFPVEPFALYGVGGIMANGLGGDKVALFTDLDNNGTFTAEAGMETTVDVTNMRRYGGSTAAIGDFFFCFAMPAQVHQAKLRVTKASGGSARPLLDQFYVRKLVGVTSCDQYNTPLASRTEFLVPDPGDGYVIATGDSYMSGSRTAMGLSPAAGYRGDFFAAGVVQALADRFPGRDFSSQVIATGMSGAAVSDFLTAAGAGTCSDDYDGTPGHWGVNPSNPDHFDCFDYAIGQFSPAVVFLNLGTNDALTGVSQSAYLDRMTRLVAKIEALGATVVLLSPTPITKDEDNNGAINGGNPCTMGINCDVGTGSAYEKAHLFRDSLRQVVLNATP